MRLAEVYSYQEEPTSTYTHDGKTYNVNAMLRQAEGLPIEQLLVSDLAWILPHTTVQPERVTMANVSLPILATPWRGRLVVVDGAHRLARAVQLGMSTLSGRVINL